MKLLKHEAEGRQIFFFDGAVIVGIKRCTENGIDLSFQGQQFFRSFCSAGLGDQLQNFVPVQCTQFSFVRFR